MLLLGSFVLYRDLIRSLRVGATSSALLLVASCTRSEPVLGVCGNGIHESEFDEECDEGQDNNDVGVCTPECKLPACGDGIRQDGEACDLGEMNGEGADCTPECQAARCGDGHVLEGVEACDDGDAGNKPEYDGLGGCSMTCDLLPVCGDGVVEAPAETCDDGNMVDGDGCDHLCQKAICGDGVVDLGEECDDSNDVDTDACLGTCVAASCGDGVVRTGVEECDDGNLIPDDGCDSACVRDRLVFLTAESFGPMSIGDLDGGDLECRKIALAYDLPNAMAFKAWLSNEYESPSTRFYRSKGRYVMVTGEVVAYGWDDLTDGSLQHGIDRTIEGVLLFERPVWTATKPDGDRWGDGLHCQSWTTSDPGVEGRAGASGYSNTAWTDIGSALVCGTSASLYCFEQF